MQVYSNPSRESDPHSLPDVEVFYLSDSERLQDTLAAHASGVAPYWGTYEDGWYWWFCFPGCLPDSEPNGPFQTAKQAQEDAQKDAD